MDSDLVSLIGAIYDAVLEPQLWWSAIDQLRRHFGFYLAGLGVYSFPSGHAILQVSVNMPPTYVEAIARYGEAALELWGGPVRAGLLPLEEPLLTSHVTPPSRWEENVFYRDWARPLGLVDQVAIFLARDDTMIASLGLGVHETSRGVTEEDLAGLRIVAPHLRRAITISRILDEATTAALTFRSALDASASGVVLVDQHMSILYANAAADAMLRAREPIAEVGRRLILTQELVSGRLEETVRMAATEESRLARRGIGIAARRSDGSPVVVHVMPLERREIRAGVPMRTAAAIFIAATGTTPLPMDAVALLFDLTPAELRVFQLIVAGRPTEAIAHELGVAPSTVRTHLLAIFGKTGRHSRAELVRLSQEVALPG